jgi:mRNA interferase HicA
MKKKELLKYLRNNGCEFLREGGRHSWWHNPTLNKKSAIPRHNEIRDI